MTGWHSVCLRSFLAAYFIFLIGYLVANPGIGYEQWHGLFSHNAMRIFSLLALVALGAHAWVGMWTISTDYLTPMALGKSATAVRFLFQAVMRRHDVRLLRLGCADSLGYLIHG